MRDKYAVFILTHGRAETIATYRTLRRCGYTGEVYFILDNEDDQKQLYEEKFGSDRIIVFDKEEAYKQTDTFDNFNQRNAIVYARNACFEIAKKLGLKYFIELDDDYDNFSYRFEKDNQLKQVRTNELDQIFDAMIDFLEDTNALSVALCQNGDLIGGLQSARYKQKVLRKAMNCFICRTDRPITFKGTFNEDVSTYTVLGSQGELFLSVFHVVLNQRATQSLPGGMTQVYQDMGTYVKTFYSLIAMPSAIKISGMGPSHYRIHHHVFWEKCVPKIISDKWKKGK